MGREIWAAALKSDVSHVYPPPKPPHPWGQYINTIVVHKPGHKHCLDGYNGGCVLLLFYMTHFVCTTGVLRLGDAANVCCTLVFFSLHTILSALTLNIGTYCESCPV